MSASAVPRQKGKVNYEARLKKVLKEVKKAQRSNEPDLINLGLCSRDYLPRADELADITAEEKQGHHGRMEEVLYPFPSIIVSNAYSLLNHQEDAGDFETCYPPERVEPDEFEENVPLTLAIVASDPSKGITGADFMAQIHAFEQGALCDLKDPCEGAELTGARRHSCGRYWLEYTDRC
ncbi:unnamed protein product [Vitrella brassicaformis CCMP3155]|uniref:Uncharacterized protein n=2 Tax=Vitrella brassicaformis TaxID=1169539 RepID=A0A0G4FWN1_VITBC|nr:unnamed protein product [Vitrella brassicaformis CCMP3155]|mmetsp:Transcript_40907/g.116536  ORF Transcript_40907/g.116536 Transcript_40907/m.116536 type:complete len:179 (+) Transcript_40907:24-560(+)|eukprot:CEM19326.1 unnamed protein product [Vitrella brassicaformis CCMP3155]